MAKKTSPEAILSDIMMKSTLESLSSTLRQEGLERAQQKWQELNDTFSEHDWWPPVARAKRKLFDEYAEMQKKEERDAARAKGGGNIFIGASMTGAQQTTWATSIDYSTHNDFKEGSSNQVFNGYVSGRFDKEQ